MRTRVLFVIPLLVAAAWAAAGAVAACGASAPRVAPAPAPLVANAALEAKIDPIATALLAKGAAAISVAVARGDEIVFAKGYGLANREKSVPATAETIYRIGSVTKQFTAVAILQLVERGKLALGDEIRKYLPDFPTGGKKITVRHLLTHTSGIHSYTDEEFVAKMATPVSLAELVGYFSGKPLEFEPGSKWSYSNSGYVLLGAILEQVSGQTYADYLHEHAWTPLGLTSTRYCDDEPTLPNDAAGYQQKDGQLAPSEPISMTTPYAAGALCSTVGDLVRWTTALHDHVVVSEASYLAMTTPVTLSDGTTAPYGFGLGLGQLEGHAVVSHGGGINGFVSDVAYYPADALTVVVLVNTESDAAAVGARRIARALLDIPEPKVEDQPLPADAATRYPGVFDFPDIGLKVTIAVEDGRLVAQATGQPKLPCLHQGNDVFLVEDHLEIQFTFGIGADGRADTLTVDQGGAHVVGRLVP